jgi:eukaryotic-like serine/threonine-protein kinase
MTLDRWQEINHLFETLIELPASSREGVLQDQSCVDPDLVSHVRRLLAQHEKSDSLLDVGVQNVGRFVNKSPTQSAWAFQEGQSVAGRFEILQRLGRGGMGEVYAAYDRALMEKVALKAIRPEMATNQRAVDRFKREVRRARRVSHSHVCRVFEFFGWEDNSGNLKWFLTMELLEGETLDQRLKEKGPLPLDLAQTVLCDTARALEAAHSAGVIHRDLKPGNVFLVERAKKVRAVVTDFGLARSMSMHGVSATYDGESREVLGTPAYMAPEQIEGREASFSSDIYGLGLLAFELMVGKRPFNAATPIRLALQHLQQRPDSPRRHRDEIPKHWEAAVLKCLAKEPELRFASPADFALELEKRMPEPEITWFHRLFRRG